MLPYRIGNQLDAFYSLPGVEKLCIKKLSTFQIPNKIYLINEFPKTNLGKIDKKLLLNFL